LEFYTIDKQDNNSKESLKITLVDSVGYGDSMELESWLSHITGYIESGLQEYQEEVEKIKKRKDADGMDRNKLKN